MNVKGVVSERSGFQHQIDFPSKGILIIALIKFQVFSVEVFFNLIQNLKILVFSLSYMMKESVNHDWTQSTWTGIVF